MTARPSAHWIARQLTEAYGWQQAPRYIVRDQDCVYGAIVIERLRAMGMVAIAKRVLGEAHRFDLTGFHPSLHKDAPIPRAVQTVGRTLAVLPSKDAGPLGALRLRFSLTVPTRRILDGQGTLHFQMRSRSAAELWMRMDSA